MLSIVVKDHLGAKVVFYEHNSLVKKKCLKALFRSRRERNISMDLHNIVQERPQMTKYALKLIHWCWLESLNNLNTPTSLRVRIAKTGV